MYIQGTCAYCGKPITEHEQWREVKEQMYHSRCMVLPKKKGVEENVDNDSDLGRGRGVEPNRREDK